MRNRILALIPAILILGVCALFDVPKQLGAHPWWSQSTLFIGAPIGLILGFLITYRHAVWPFSALTLLAFGVAHYGKTQFSASFAEDAFAGKLWHFGWIGTAIGCALTLVALGHFVLSFRK